MRLLLLLPLAVILYACPYGSAVPLQPAPTQAVDTSLCGFWYGIIRDGSDFFGIEALEISAQTDSLYSIIRYGKAMKGDMIQPDTSYYTGFTSLVGGQLYMTARASITELSKPRKKKAAEPITRNTYYIAAISRRNDTLSVKTLSEDFSPAGRIGFSQPEQLKTEMLSRQAQGAPIFDEVYSLEYRKITWRPALR